jgi:hypothetical protein
MYIDPDWALTLFTMRFPCLRSLTLDTLDEGIHSPLGFHDFLLVHNQALEHLDLGYTSRRQVDPAALVFSADAVFEPHCLPSLRVFRGHYRNVETMAGARMQCLTGSLTKLTIGLGRVEDSKGKIDRMLDAIETAGCLSTLKELDFDFFQSQADEREWIPTFIRRWGEICGSSLEIWTGLFPFVWSWLPEELAAFFGAFSKLRVIWLANDSTVFGVFPGGEHDNGEDDDEEYVRSLARKRSSLEEVWLTWGDIASCWKLERGPGSALVVRQIGDC